MRALRDLFPQFFDPRAPLLFLVGSLALAVLSNAVYELLRAAVGDSPGALAAITTLAALVFVGVVYAFQRIGEAVARHRLAGQSLVAPEQRAEAHAGLVLPVGLNPDGPEAAILAYHARGERLRHCWLIVSPEVERSSKLGDLRQWLNEHNVEDHLLRVRDANQADESYAAVRAGIAAARATGGAAPLIVDITSGVKAMTAGMVLACRDEAVPIQYLPATRDAAGNPRPWTGVQPMQVQVRGVGAEETL